MDPQKKLAYLLANYTVSRGVSRHRLAQMVEAEVSRQTVYNALDGKPIQSDKLFAILDALNLTFDIKPCPKKGSR